MLVPVQENVFGQHGGILPENPVCPFRRKNCSAHLDFPSEIFLFHQIFSEDNPFPVGLSSSATIPNEL